MHDASVLPGRHPKLCCIILIPFVKMPFFLFLFQDFTKASAISCPTVLSVNSKPGVGGEETTKQKKISTILRNFASKSIKQTLQDNCILPNQICLLLGKD